MATTTELAQGSTGRYVRFADISVLAIAVIWGASYPVTKIALAYEPVLVVIFYRFFMTACIMSWMARRELSTASKTDMSRGAILGLILASIFAAEVAGVGMTSATNAALIISLCTLLTPFLEFGLKRQLPPYLIVAGAVTACAGVGLLVGGLSDWSLGDSLILLAAGLRAVMVVSTKRLMAESPLSSKALTAIQATTVTLVAIIILTATLGPSSLLVGSAPQFWLSTAFLSVFCTIAAFYVQNAAVRRTSPTRVGLLMGTEPLFGFALAHVMLSEPVTAATVIGAVMIVGGTLVGLAGDRRAKDRSV